MSAFTAGEGIADSSGLGASRFVNLGHRLSVWLSAFTKSVVPSCELLPQAHRELG